MGNHIQVKIICNFTPRDNSFFFKAKFVLFMKYFIYTEIHLNFYIPFILSMYVHMYAYFEFGVGGIFEYTSHGTLYPNL